MVDPTSGEEKQLSLSAECKGILGGDDRYYLFELARLQPPDPHFYHLAVDQETSDKLPSYPHKMSLLRRELIEAVALVNKSKSQPENTELGLSTISTSNFKYTLNPDIYLSHVETPPSEFQESEAQLYKAVDHLKNVIIPRIAHDMCIVGNVPHDGQGLTTICHEHGVNLRYLGELAKAVDLVALNENIGEGIRSYVKSLVLSEMIVRAAKHILRPFFAKTEKKNWWKVCMAHLLNCALIEDYPTFVHIVSFRHGAPLLFEKVIFRCTF